MRRFFSDRSIESSSVVITGQEAIHMARVIRVRAGDRVVLFDGSGAQFEAEVVRVGRNQVELNIVEKRSVHRELPGALHIGVPLPKGDRQHWLVEKAVELGVTHLIVLKTARSTVEPSSSGLERLRRYVIEASKQCGRNRLMQIDWQPEWESFLRMAPSQACRWLAHADSRATAWQLLVDQPAKTASNPFTEIWAAIGPEGGWTQEEVAVAESLGWHPVWLGPRILRVETAACVVATLAALLLARTAR